ncbi:YARHG domain-containing protein [Fusobacterium polymorphum]|uniref:YARHG domain-containing protein n=1 Tax=Fusobacterium nucleatum subsp. polymorphum TaxID=76857 RepID=UPI0030085204
MKDDFNDLENINIEEGNIAENNDETSPDSLLKIDPIKSLDSSNIKIEIPKTEIKKEESKVSDDDFQNINKTKANSKIIKIGIVALIVILCLVGGYFAYSKFVASDESEELADNTVTEEVIEESPQEAPVEEASNITETPVVETSQETTVEEENTQENEPVIEEPTNEENSVQVNDDNYDLVVLDKVYDEVINKGNEAYLNNFSSDELAIIRNTLYARNGYKFKKKEYQKYFGEKSWYNPTTSSQNILTRNEEKLANIIKKYE